MATIATRSVFQRQWNKAAWVNKHGHHHLWCVCVSASGFRTACKHHQRTPEQTAPVGHSLMMSTSWSPWIISLARTQTLPAEEFISGRDTTTERGPKVTAVAHSKERCSHYNLGVLGEHENWQPLAETHLVHVGVIHKIFHKKCNTWCEQLDLVPSLLEPMERNLETTHIILLDDIMTQKWVR